MSDAMPHVVLFDGTGVAADDHELRRLVRTARDPRGATYVSRAYRFPYALRAWHDTPVGADLERIEPYDRQFAASICTPAELEHVDGEDPAREERTASLWCAKEALSKALGNALLYDPRRLEAPQAWAEGRSGPWRALRLGAPARHVAWLCWRTAAA